MSPRSRWGQGNPGSHGEGRAAPLSPVPPQGRGQGKASRPRVSSSPARTNVGSGVADGPGRSPKLLTCHQPCLCPSLPQPCLLRPFLIQILLSFSLDPMRTSKGSLQLGTELSAVDTMCTRDRCCG